MSVQAMSWVWEMSEQSGSALLVLLAIANHAHEDGTSAFPSIGTLAEESRMSSRAVKYIIVKLKASGELLVREDSGPRGCNTYEIPGVVSDGFHLPGRRRHGAKFAPSVNSAVGQNSRAVGQNSTSLGAIAVAPEPSLTVEPSGSAPSSPAVDLREQPHSNTSNGAGHHPGKNVSKALKRIAGEKDLNRVNASRSDPQLKHLEDGIYRHHVRSAYFDGRDDGHEKAFRYAVDQAVLSLTSNRAVELRGISSERLGTAAWLNLRPYVEHFAAIADYSRRQNLVVGAIVSVVAKVALTLQANSGARPIGTTILQSVAANG